MSDENERYVDPNSGAAPQPGGFANAKVEAGAEPKVSGRAVPEEEPEGEYDSLLAKNVSDVQDHLDQNPGEADAIKEAERAGQARKGILEYEVEPEDEEVEPDDA